MYVEISKSQVWYRNGTGIKQESTGIKQESTGIRQDGTGLKQDTIGTDHESEHRRNRRALSDRTLVVTMMPVRKHEHSNYLNSIII